MAVVRVRATPGESSIADGGKSNRRKRALHWAVASIAIAPWSRAATDVYTGASGDWSAGANWSLGTPPVANQAVVLRNSPGGSVTVTFVVG